MKISINLFTIIPAPAGDRVKTKLMNQIVLHQFYIKSHTKLLVYLSSMASYVGIQKKVTFFSNDANFQPFLVMFSQKCLFGGN